MRSIKKKHQVALYPLDLIRLDKHQVALDPLAHEVGFLRELSAQPLVVLLADHLRLQHRVPLRHQRLHLTGACQLINYNQVFN